MINLQTIIDTIAGLERLKQQPHDFSASAVQAEIDDWAQDLDKAFGFDEPSLFVVLVP